MSVSPEDKDAETTEFLEWSIDAYPLHEHYVEFEVFEQAPDWSEEKKILFFSGAVKWDGCSNWSFKNSEGHPIHFCGLDDVENFSKLFKKIYELAAEYMPKSKDEILYRYS